MQTSTIVRARIASIRPSFLDRVRTAGLDDLGQPVKRVVAEGGEPCRDVLRRARPGEQLILASYSPFEKPGPYHEYGPIFILAEPSAEDVSRDSIRAGSEEDYLRGKFAVRAYSSDEEIVDAALVDASSAPRVIDELFAHSDAAFLHVRFPAYGCFACRLDKT